VIGCEWVDENEMVLENVYGWELVWVNENVYGWELVWVNETVVGEAWWEYLSLTG
jgi:hypothetical protein